MKYSQLGRTGLKVSSLCLGTMNWGEQNDAKQAHAQLDCAVNMGINFIDTAELYPSPPAEETYGRTEEILGDWLGKRTDRDRLVIATKIAPAAKSLTWLRNGDNRLDRKNIQAAVDASLKRLQTDYIDLYQIHWPERFTNYFGQLHYRHAPEKDGSPISDTLEALDEIVQSGKVRYLGVANESAWGLSRYLCLSERQGASRVVSIQNPYNLLNRLFEINLSEFAHREQVGLLAYSPLAFGMLTGKYTGKQDPGDTRITRHGKVYSRYSNEIGNRMTEKYVALAEEAGLVPARMAIAFILSRPFVTSVITGASSVEQLQSNIASIDVELDSGLLQKIDSLHFSQPNPCP